ncbi:MAG: lamin tail domain-containing protein, partial [Thermoplasmata archaeon]|nr:lamin tail domain-containing protein [Thermoplasmata archaeon]
MSKKVLKSDSRANSAFAFAAVIILLTVGVVGAGVYQTQKINRDMISAQIEAEAAIRTRELVISECELALQMAATKALNSAKQPFNISLFQEDIKKILMEHFDRSYPLYVGRISVNASLRNISAAYETYQIKGVSNSSVPAGITICITIDMAAVSENINYKTSIEISKQIETPVPFFATKLDRIDKASKSEGELARIVRNILTQLAQLRIIQGYGVPGHPEDKSVREIITAKDVEIAVNLALQLTELSDFGTVDAGAWEALIEKSGRLESLAAFSDWFSGRIDPFKTFMFLRCDATSAGVNQRDFAVQIMYSLIDRFVLRNLEYLCLIDVPETFELISIAAGEQWKVMLESLTGVQTRLEDTQDRVASKLEEINLPECLWNGIFSDSADVTIAPLPSYIYIFDSNGRLTPIAIGNSEANIDLPSRSIIDSEAWIDFREILLQNIVRIGEKIERLVIMLCMHLAEGIPAVEIYPTNTGKEPIVLEILDRLKKNLEDIQIETAIPIDYDSDILRCDDLLIALKDFINRTWDDLLPLNEIISDARENLAKFLADSAIVSNPECLPDNWRDEVAVLVGRLLSTGDLEYWDRCISGEIQRISNLTKKAVILFIDDVNNAPAEFEGTVPNNFLKWLAEGLLGKRIMDGVRGWVDALDLQISNLTRELSLDEQVSLPPKGAIELMGENKQNASASRKILPILTQSPNYLNAQEIAAGGLIGVENLDPTGKLLVSVASPGSIGVAGTKSIHYTNIDGNASFPFENNWRIRIRGLVEIALKDSLDQRQSAMDEVLVDIELTITAFSGWALDDVSYESSNTLMGDAWNLLMEIKNRIWEFISPLIEGFQKMFSFIYDCLSEISRYICGFIEKVGKLLFEVGCWVISVIRDVVNMIRGSPIWGFIEIVLDALGRIDIRFSYGPFGVVVGLSLPDLLFRKAKDLVRLIFILNLGDLKLSWGFRIAKLSNGLIDIIANTTIRCGSLRLDMRCDPFMEIRDHLFEIEGRWEGIKFQIWSPEIDDYKQAGAQLKDIPGLGGLLSSIPVPLLGISISINAGLLMKYRLPLCDQLVINEVELNPSGKDAGREWVEIYNPLTREVSVEGFRLETMHGEIAVLELSGCLPARGYKVFTFSKTSLDNGDPSDSFADGDSIALIDSNGKVLDITPVISDRFSDRMTWQRTWDGAPKWVFKESTKASTNGNPLIHTYPDLVAK